MNYHTIYLCDICNGPGLRCTLFVSGCEHQCIGCHNPHTWDITSGKLFDSACEDKIISALQSQERPLAGLSVSGGDPLHPSNIPDMLRLLQRVKEAVPAKDIWVWTGYTLKDLNATQKTLLKYIDVLVDGPYVRLLADKRLPWRGSRNQKIIRQPASFLDPESA